MGHGRDRCVFTQTTLTVSQLTLIEHENTHLHSARTFQTMVVLLRVHGRVHQPEFSRTRTSTSTQSTRYDLRTAHVRGEMKHKFRTV